VLTNLFIAVVFGLAIRLGPFLGLPLYDPLSPHPFYTITFLIVLVNLALAIFNLVPIPPLDGSKILFSFLPYSFYRTMVFLEQYSLILLLIFVIFFANYLSPIMAHAFTFITGLAF